MFHASSLRVPMHTARHVNEAVRRRTQDSLRYHAENPDRIGERLSDLDREWDVERVLEANAAGISLVGLALAHTVDRRWTALPAAVVAFLLQHAVQGWCPPLPVFRRLGYRTRAEIDSERYALKALRGDFQRVADAQDKPSAALRAVRA